MTTPRRFVIALGFPLLVAARALATGPDAATVDVGTHTDAGSRGIDRFTFDLATGTASPAVLCVLFAGR